MLEPNKNARLLSDLLKKVDEKKPEKETLAQVNSSFCLNKNKNKIAEFTQSLDAMHTKLSGLAERSFADVLRSNGYARTSLTSSAPLLRMTDCVRLRTQPNRKALKRQCLPSRRKLQHSL